MSKVKHSELANAIRFLSIDAVQQANSTKLGMPMGMADICTVLFKNFLRFDPNNPGWIIEIDLLYQMVMVQCCYTRFYI